MTSSGWSRGVLVAVGLLALGVPAPAAARRHRLRFQVVSIEGAQTATWNDTRTGCGTIARSGSQTIAFKSSRPRRFSLTRLPRYTRSGKRRGFTFYGATFVRSDWTFTRTFSQSVPPVCAEPLAARASDCGTKGPFAVPVDIAWRDGALELRGVLDRFTPGRRSPNYRTCEYDGFHEFDLIDSKGRLPRRRLTQRRRRLLRVKVRGRAKEPTAESEGSQVTSLSADVTLRRLR